MRIFLPLTIALAAACITCAQAARLETDSVYSVSMKKQIPADIILPAFYGVDDTVIFYPVIYLLHGYSGSFTSYPTRYPHLLEMADSFNIIFV
jgi:hypothetical protein